MRNGILLSAVMGMLSACGSTGIVKLEADRYMISEKNAKVGFVSAAEEKASVYREANKFCSGLGKEVQTLDLQMIDSGLGRQASASLEFKCISAK
jgi:hypothetical protein